MRAQGSTAFTNHAVRVVTANGRQALTARDKQSSHLRGMVSAIAAMFRRSRPDRVSDETPLLPCAHARAARARAPIPAHIGGAISRGTPTNQRSAGPVSAHKRLSRSARWLGIAGRGSPRFPHSSPLKLDAT